MPGTKETQEKQAIAFLYLRKEKWLQEHPEMKYNKGKIVLQKHKSCRVE